MKNLSYDDDFKVKFDFLGKKIFISNAEAKNIKVCQYLLCKYDSLYWIGIAWVWDPSAYNIYKSQI